MRAESAIVEQMIVSMIGLSCDLNQDAHVYLLEDGLELWLAVLENATVLTTGMRDLFRNMPALLGKKQTDKKTHLIKNNIKLMYGK